MKRVMTAALCGVGLLAASATANAALLSGQVASGDLTTVIPGGTVVDFDAATPGDYASISIGAATFSSVGAPLTIGPDFNGAFNTRGVNSLLTGFDLDPDSFQITLSTPVSAFAFLWGASDNTWLMEVFDSSDTLIESHGLGAVFASNAGDYYGVSAAGIAKIRLTDTGDRLGVGDYVFLDNFTFAAGEAVPEPATALLLMLGLGGIGAFRKRAK